MNNQSAEEMDRCLHLIHSLVELAKRDAEEMDRCTKGPVLDEYRLTMDRQIRRLHRMEQLLSSIR